MTLRIKLIIFIARILRVSHLIRRPVKYVGWGEYVYDDNPIKHVDGHNHADP